MTEFPPAAVRLQREFRPFADAQGPGTAALWPGVLLSIRVGVRASMVDGMRAASTDESRHRRPRHHDTTFDDVDPSSVDRDRNLVGREAHHRTRWNSPAGHGGESNTGGRISDVEGVRARWATVPIAGTRDRSSRGGRAGVGVPSGAVTLRFALSWRTLADVARAGSTALASRPGGPL